MLALHINRIEDGAQAALMSCIIVCSIVLNEVFGLLIDRIVRQMHAEVV